MTLSQTGRLTNHKATSFEPLYMNKQMSWQKVFSTRYYTEAAIVSGKLEENEIPVQVLNKQDSMYNVALGEIEVYVPGYLADLARGLLSKTIEN